MKKLLILVAFLSTAFLSCKKDKAQTGVETASLSVEDATLIVSGTLAFSSETSIGTVKVYKQKNGKYVLALENVNLKVSRPSYVIYLSPSETVSTSAIKICSVANLSGNLLHALPANADFSLLKYLVIQTEPSDEYIAIAELR